MSGDLISLRMLLVGAEEARENSWREAATQASVPIDFDAGNPSAAKVALSRGGVDFCVLDAALDDADRASMIKAARAKKPTPLIFASLSRGSARPDKIDGLLATPKNPGEALKLIEICVRAKMPTQVLVAADSDSLRGVVRKILKASRFTLDIHEAEDSAETLDRLRKGSFGLVFLDYNMPRLNGADVLHGIKREHPNLAVVMMSSSLNRGAAGRPQASEALASLRKPFYPADVDAVLERYFGLLGRP